MRIWHVTATAYNLNTGRELGTRTETVDSTNRIFRDCRTILDVHDAYENFWKHLTSETPREVVFVQAVYYGESPDIRPGRYRRQK